MSTLSDLLEEAKAATPLTVRIPLSQRTLGASVKSKVSLECPPLQLASMCPTAVLSVTKTAPPAEVGVAEQVKVGLPTKCQRTHFQACNASSYTLTFAKRGLPQVGSLILVLWNLDAFVLQTVDREFSISQSSRTYLESGNYLCSRNAKLPSLTASRPKQRLCVLGVVSFGCSG